MDSTRRLGTLLQRLSGLCLLGAGTIHLAAAPVHTGHDASIGAFFWVAGAVQILLGLALLVHGGRRLLALAGVASAGIIGLWIVSRTAGLAGLSTPAEAESIEVADAVATGLEAAVVVTALLLLRPAIGLRRLTPAPFQASLAVLAMLIGAVTAPAVLAAPDHGGDDHHNGGQHTEEMADGHHGAGSAAAVQPTSDHHGADPSAAHHGDAAGNAMGDEHESNAFVFGEESHHTSEPCDATPEQQAAADRLLAHTKAGLARLADIDVARNEGYMRYGDSAISGTWHYINWEYQADPDVLNPNKPESIVYWQATPEAPLIIIGAMYVMPEVEDRGPTIGGCITRWHTHGAPFGPADRQTNEMLHTWIVPLPDGPFV